MAQAERVSAAPTLDVLFRQHAHFVGWVALRILGRDEDIDDIVQEVFLSALRGLRSLRDPAAARAWLKTVTVRTARRRLYKRRLRRMLRLDDEPRVHEIAAPGADPADLALLRRVYAALDLIPVAERLPWTLHQVEGETLPEVARLCGCSLATVKRRIAAAQRRLDEELGT